MRESRHTRCYMQAADRRYAYFPHYVGRIHTKISVACVSLAPQVTGHSRSRACAEWTRRAFSLLFSSTDGRAAYSAMRLVATATRDFSCEAGSRSWAPRAAGRPQGCDGPSVGASPHDYGTANLIRMPLGRRARSGEFRRSKGRRGAGDVPASARQRPPSSTPKIGSWMPLAERFANICGHRAPRPPSTSTGLEGRSGWAW